MRTRGLILLLGVGLAACQSERMPAPEPPREFDPAIVAALQDPLMIDPDLVTQNRGDTVITQGGFDALPLEVEPAASALAKTGD